MDSMTESITNEKKPHKNFRLKQITGWSITLLCITLFLRQINLKEVLHAIEHFRWFYLILSIISLAVGYTLRISRWSMMLKATGSNVSLKSCSFPFLGSIALNNILPLRLGDVIRALIFPKSMGITKVDAICSLLVERLIDLMTLLASLAIGLFSLGIHVIPLSFRNSVVVLAIIGSLALTLGFFFSKPVGIFLKKLSIQPSLQNSSVRYRELLGKLATLLHSFNMMSRPILLVAMLTISMLIWFFEAGLFYFMLLGLDIINANFVMALLVMAVTTLSTLIPSSPGYIGPFHLAAFMAVTLVGGDSVQAGSYAVLVHMALWVPTTLAGVVAIFFKPTLFYKAKQHV